MSTDAWVPGEAIVAEANVTRLMQLVGVAGLPEMRRRSAADPEWFWPAVLDDLGIVFPTPFTQVVDTAGGPGWARWFIGGRINISAACLDRWADDPVAAGRPALIAENETGRVTRMTFSELRAAVAGAAAALRALGIGRGDACGVFMPYVPEAVIAMYAIARVGAVAVPIFSGFAAPAVSARLRDAEVRVVLCGAGTLRRGRLVAVAATLRDALPDAPGVEAVVVVPPADVPSPDDLGPVRTLSWDGFLTLGAGRSGEPEDTAAEDPFLIAYTSGTTGRPKGVVHVHGGFLVKVASEVAYALDARPGEPFFWFTEMGWIMGPLSMIGAHACGAPLGMYDGAPDAPDPGRLWRFVEDHRVGVLGVSPTLVRSLRTHDDGHHRAADLSSVRILGSTGEAWNPAPYLWLRDTVFGGTRPVINISGGTEVGAVILSPYPVEEIRPCSVGGPVLGMDADVYDADGAPVRGEVGELVVRGSWPGMTRGIWRDPGRYMETYWSTYPGVWRHGDWARIDGEGDWYVLGRSDETMNIAGKRVGAAEVESVLMAHPDVREAAAIGVADPIKGEGLWCFWSPRDVSAAEASDELAALIVRDLGKPFRPNRVIPLATLPRTRSGKVMRRVLRAVAEGADPGDLSTAEDLDTLEAIRRAIDA